MKFINTKINVINILNIVLVMLLVGCSASHQSISRSVKIANNPQNYKRLVQVLSEHKDLKSSLISMMSTGQNVVIVNDGNSNEFRVLVRLRSVEQKSLSNKPKLFGKLSRDKILLSFTVDYIVATQANHVLARGTVKEQVEINNSIYPRLDINKHIPEGALQLLTRQVYKEVMGYIQAVDWSVTIIDIRDGYHILIGAGEESGVRVGDFFVTETLPSSIFKVVSFMPYGDNATRALLVNIKGGMPMAGRKLRAIVTP